jgi:amidase
MELDRRSLFRMGVTTLALSACKTKPAEDPPSTPWPAWPLSKPKTVGVGITGLPSPEVVEVDIAELRRRLEHGETTSLALVRAYVARITALNDTLHAVLETNDAAEAIANQLDAERAAGKLRGPLHGIPVLVKDNIDTTEMHTTAGSLALADHPPQRDAFVIGKLRAAGAIILGKANLSEWANLRGTQSISGWSARGGQCRNPYALDRSASGSSSGSAAATAASLCAASLGSETDGSITSPASMCALVGIKPTVGLVSRAGVIPISSSQDTVGPIARTVTDTAIMLTAIAGSDPEDPATVAAKPEDYTKHLDPNALRGARIGVPRKGWFGVLRPLDTVMTTALAKLAELGAVLVDPVELEVPPALAAAEGAVFLCEMKPAMNAYLARRGHPTIHTLLDLILFNFEHADAELGWFGQEYFQQAQARAGLEDAGYAAARAQCLDIARDQLLDAAMQKHQLDAFAIVTGGLPWLIDSLTGDTIVGPNTTQLAAVAGYPHITVPAGSFHGLPIGLSLFGAPYSEGKLFGYAYAFEQATNHRVPPRYLATAEL